MPHAARGFLRTNSGLINLFPRAAAGPETDSVAARAGEVQSAVVTPA
jgi:hypothetical protein